MFLSVKNIFRSLSIALIIAERTKAWKFIVVYYAKPCSSYSPCRASSPPRDDVIFFLTPPLIHRQILKMRNQRVPGFECIRLIAMFKSNWNLQLGDSASSSSRDDAWPKVDFEVAETPALVRVPTKQEEINYGAVRWFILIWIDKELHNNPPIWRKSY